jgi:hydrogenase maturation protease
VTVDIENTSPCPLPAAGERGTRDALATYAFTSTHTVLHTDGGEFVSLTDPPAELAEAAAACENVGVWPVLVSEDPRAARLSPHYAPEVLSSPITLYDYPSVAPESPGDLFDGGEIDQLLILSVLSLTPREQEEARASDPRAREILDRCASLEPEDLAALHGTIRAFRPVLEGR